MEVAGGEEVEETEGEETEVEETEVDSEGRPVVVAASRLLMSKSSPE